MNRSSVDASGHDGELTEWEVSAGWQAQLPTDSDIRLLRTSVLQLAQALTRLVSSEDLLHPAPETLANGWISSSANWSTLEGASHVENVLGGIGTVCLGAASHMTVLVDSVVRGKGSVAVWTLTRAIIESLGRVNYLLGAQDVFDLLSRHVALIRAEMKYAEHNVLIIRDRGRLKVDDYLADLTTMLNDVGAMQLKAPSYTTLATNLLEEAAPDNGSRGRYSQLSGVAHGELPALQMFLSPGVGLVLPRVLLLEAVHMLCGAGILVGDKLRDTISMPASATAARWNSPRDRALLAARSLS